MKLLRLLKQITAIITLYTLQTKLRIAPVALVETSLSRLLYSMRGTALTSFSYTKMHGRVVTCRDARSGILAYAMPDCQCQNRLHVSNNAIQSCNCHMNRCLII